ncbi:SDR family oxidoreductase [Anaeromicrobium sediminis]|nr:SDR family oxidoreductase [Anaeromicrobium sediminis]
MQKSIVVTGASSGFGKLIVETLAKDGHKVFATMRGVEGKNTSVAEEYKNWAEENNYDLHVLEMDVSSDDSVNEGIKRILSLTNRVDVIVNNAGYGVPGVTEGFTSEDTINLFNTNVVGPMRVNNGLLPTLRKQGEGLLIQITSGSAHGTVPFMGVYSATKSAIDTIAESYHYDLAQLGIESVTIEPGSFPTEGPGKMRPPANGHVIKEYGVVAEAMNQLFNGMEEMVSGDKVPNPQDVADEVKKLIDTPAGQRPLRTVVGELMADHARKVNAATEPIQKEFLESLGVAYLDDFKK